MYDRPNGTTAVFVDGPAHDDAHRADTDAAAEARLLDAGWHVVGVRYDDDWSAVMAALPSVFGSGRGAHR